jgi:hypothetical protein
MRDDNRRMPIFRPVYGSEQLRHIGIRAKFRFNGQFSARHARQRFRGLDISFPMAAKDSRAIGQARLQPIRHLGCLFPPFATQFAGKVVPMLDRDSIRVAPQNEIHGECSNKVVSSISQPLEDGQPGCHEAVTIGS